ncbi:Bug family tripartite tricarboxylate transporter substrate binding protein [Ottowia sp.]|uniref:Bug family tripartite tricarboxylate transporter substrate binding protein n=1 Tax=Ottowia sp. TaxID=1898956 RepID=UPI0039E4F317
MKRRHLFAAALMAASSLLPAFGQDYPNKPLKLLVPFPPGAGTDATARIVGQKLSEQLGQPVVVENISGANGLIGTRAMARAAPDGYTLGIAAPGPIAIAQFLFPTMPYDPEADFTPVIKINEARIGLAVGPAVPARTVDELIALIRKNAGQINAANPTVGSVMHLVAETFKDQGKLDFKLIPYKGGAQATNEVLGGQVEMIFNGVSTLASFAKAGRLRMLMVVGDTRSALVPDVPSSRELGLGYLSGAQWHGIVVPKATPPAIVARLHAELAKVLANPEVKEKLAGIGTEVSTGSQEDFARFLQSERNRWGPLIKKANIQPD